MKYILVVNIYNTRKLLLFHNTAVFQVYIGYCHVVNCRQEGLHCCNLCKYITSKKCINVIHTHAHIQTCTNLTISTYST